MSDIFKDLGLLPWTKQNSCVYGANILMEEDKHWTNIYLPGSVLGQTWQNTCVNRAYSQVRCQEER